MAAESKRFYVVDALRGFAIISIMLLHNIEHFDFYYVPENIPQWMASIDTIIWDTMFFLFGGKSYAMFALLFGLTFYIQMHNQEKHGEDFRPRFAWRMFLLLIFGIINSAFFQGDILSIYAILGILLIPVARFSDKALFIIAIILFLQPYEMIRLFIAIQNPEMQISDPDSWAYFGKMSEYAAGDSLFATIKGNLTNGKVAVLLWNWENGRYFHILALFIFGLLAGRRKLFAWNDATKQFWTKALIISAVAFIPLFAIKTSTGNLIDSDAIRRSFSIIETSWTNISFMIVLLSGFVLLFHSKLMHKVLNVFTPIGKMSLSNYVFQSIIGASIYYGFGLGLYKHANTTPAFLIGLVLAVITWLLCSWWAANHKRGPLEAIWHKATWFNSEKRHH
jgi:uncharacterized protein